MKKIALIAALVLFAGTAAASTAKPITNLDDFFRFIVDKKLDFGVGHQIFHKDGNITGIYKGREMEGTWIWEKTTFCQTIGLKGRVGKPDCGRKTAVEGNKVAITRGDGTTFTVTILPK